MKERTAFEMILRRILLWIVSLSFLWPSYRPGETFDPSIPKLVFHALASIAGWGVVVWMVWYFVFK
jgi:hypothetical protein